MSDATIDGLQNWVNDIATTEGWRVLSDGYHLVIEKTPDDGRFENNTEAVEFVAQKALEGSKPHAAALWMYRQEDRKICADDLPEALKPPVALRNRISGFLREAKEAGYEDSTIISMIREVADGPSEDQEDSEYDEVFEDNGIPF